MVYSNWCGCPLRKGVKPMEYVTYADSVYKMLNKDIERKTYLYARVSTAKQKKGLENQVQLLKHFVFRMDM